MKFYLVGGCVSLLLAIFTLLPESVSATPGGHSNIYGVTKRKNIYGMKKGSSLKRGNLYGAQGKGLKNNYFTRGKLNNSGSRSTSQSACSIQRAAPEVGDPNCNEASSPR